MANVVGKIRRRSSFRALARPDGRASNRGVSVSYRRESDESRAAALPVVAYAIGRRHGGAVARNRLRRRLRAAVQEAGPGLARGAYLVRADPSVAQLPFAELGAAVRSALGAAAGRAAGTRGPRPPSTEAVQP
jgi:ribonuclease P protein component